MSPPPYLQNLSGLTNVRRMSFADNQISHIEGLECCTACEELCLEDNRIGSIEGLQGLTR
jgi:Leucine-rich repeat (LRR) protein